MDYNSENNIASYQIIANNQSNSLQSHILTQLKLDLNQSNQNLLSKSTHKQKKINNHPTNYINQINYINTPTNRSKFSQTNHKTNKTNKKIINQYLQSKQKKDKQRAILRQKKKNYSQYIRDKINKIPTKPQKRHSINPNYNSYNHYNKSTKQNHPISTFQYHNTSTINKNHNISHFHFNNYLEEPQGQFLQQSFPNDQSLLNTHKNNQNTQFKKHKRTNAQQSLLITNLCIRNTQKDFKQINKKLEISQIDITKSPQIQNYYDHQCKVQQWALLKHKNNQNQSQSQFSIKNQEKTFQDQLIIQNLKQQDKSKILQLQKQLIQSQNYTKQLQNKIEDLLFWKNQFPNVLLKKMVDDSSNNNYNFSFPIQNQLHENKQQNGKLKNTLKGQQKVNKFIMQRLLSLEEQAYSLRKVKNSLQLKIYSNQRRLTEQVNSIKKKCSKQINLWKKRYDDIAKQNSILKGNLNESFTMQISRDQ